MNTKKVIIWSITVALGGFLFGFDTAVISGADLSIQKLWALNDLQQGLTISIALFGTVFGALFGGIPSNSIGRKKTLVWIAALYLISAVGSSLAFDWYSFLFFRFIGGLGVGASSVAAPMYISEISPAKSRGKLVALFQFNIVFGILVAFLSNYLMDLVLPGGWRWMLGMEALPAIAFLLLVNSVPYSPRWLVVKKNNTDEALKILKVINKGDDERAQAELDAIIKSKHGEQKSNDSLFSGKYSRPIMLAVVLAIFNQVSGINAIIYYTPRIFEMTGLGTSTALLSTTGIGLINFIFTLLAMAFIDRFGRRTLMLIGSVGLIATLGLVSSAFYSNNFGGYNVPVYLFIYIAFFAFSQGAVIWVFIAEIFPNQVRAGGQSLGSFTHWIMNACLTFIFPYITEKIGGGHTFMFFSVMMVFQLVFVIFIMPETRGKSLEELENG